MGGALLTTDQTDSGEGKKMDIGKEYPKFQIRDNGWGTITIHMWLAPNLGGNIVEYVRGHGGWDENMAFAEARAAELENNYRGKLRSVY